jgi:signal transduction histidine kinase
MQGKTENIHFPLKDALLKAIKDTLANAETKSIALNYDIEDDLGKIYGDELSIQEITGNLILKCDKIHS